jgi:hypothetical protein
MFNAISRKSDRWCLITVLTGVVNLKTLRKTSLLSLLTYTTSSVHARRDTNSACIAAPRTIHVTTVSHTYVRYNLGDIYLTVSWNSWRGVLRTPFIVLTSFTSCTRFVNCNPPQHELTHTHIHTTHVQLLSSSSTLLFSPP